jgi:hypothetical protein
MSNGPIANPERGLIGKWANDTCLSDTGAIVHRELQFQGQGRLETSCHSTVKEVVATSKGEGIWRVEKDKVRAKMD